MEKSKKMGLWLLLVTMFQTPLTELFGASAKKKSHTVVSSKKTARKAAHKTPKNHSNITEKRTSSSTTFVEKGRACIYSNNLHGSATASGERFNKNAMTAAHLNLPLGTQIRVTSMETGQSVVVRINDRGPFSKKYVLDMSQSAAEKIGLNFTKGTMNVKIERIAP